MRNISFALTTKQFVDGTKDVTRRLGWANVKAGEHLMGCQKCQGLKPGEQINRLGAITVTDASREPLEAITPEDVVREGFPGMTTAEFVSMFCAHHKGCQPQTVITRIEFEPYRFATILADPPWRFENRTGKVAPEHGRLHRYETMSLAEICEFPVPPVTAEAAHLYLWVPNAMLPDGLEVMRAWGFTYKTNLVWFKTRKDGGPDGRGCGFYFRNVTELLLFGVRAPRRRAYRTKRPWNRVNLLAAPKRDHSRKPEEFRQHIEASSTGPYLELFARDKVPGWTQWGDEI